MAKDVDLFAKAMAGVKPLDGRPRTKPPAAAKATPAKAAAAAPAVRLRATAVGPDLAPDDRTFDRDVDRSLSRGRLNPDATLDLHGLTLASAERAVSRFLEQATAQDSRVALIVTGKGFREENGRRIEGRIRAEFVGWLNRPENRARVRAVRPAHPRHGGSGAFYVLLRRRSSASKRSLRATPQR
ncbi:MAG: DNA mismatch repair protein MutS [Rhodospirillaceae bacterium]|nr:DNA mismatch repair protein MutS [Rhodospirillaceae bacterium]